MPGAWRYPDCWLWDHHEFYPSRLPGYPVPELASAAVIKGGPVATNGLTVLISLVGLWFFARIVDEARTAEPAGWSSSRSRSRRCCGSTA